MSPNPSPFPYLNFGQGSNGFWTGSAGIGITPPSPTTYSVVCDGPITATFTWVPDYDGEPAPDQVIITEESHAQWRAVLAYGTSLSTTHSCDNGIGSPEVDNANGTLGSSDGTRYQVQSGGNTVLLTCNASAKSICPAGTPNCANVYASVSYSAALAPVTINLAGTTLIKGPPAALGVLIGQGLNATLSTGSFPQSNWKWNASGDPFAGFAVLPDESHPTTGHAVELTAAMKQQAAFSYYYRSVGSSGENSTVTCTVTVTLPDGTKPQVTASKKVQVFAPTHTSNPSPGTVDVPTLSGGIFGPVPTQWLIAYNDPVGKRGITWQVSVTPPTNFKVPGVAQWAFVQIITPSFSYTDFAGAVHLAPNNGKTGLDLTFPYDGSYPDDGLFHRYGDSPGMKLLPLFYEAATIGPTFQTFMLYRPADVGTGTTWVPLYEVDWNASGSASNALGLNVFVSNDGRVTITKNTPTKTLPTWTQVIRPVNF